MKSKMNAFILAIPLVLAFGALGCGSVSSDGGAVLGAGAVGGGGTGGTGGAGGIGGMGGSGTGGSGVGGSGGMGGVGGAPGASNCPDDVIEKFNASYPQLGFKNLLQPQKATLTKVSANSLETTLEASGEALAFPFGGPDLSAYFTIGEIVDVWRDGKWSVVKNATTMAAVFIMYKFTKNPATDYETPGGGPVINFKPQCNLDKPNLDCPEGVVVFTPLQLVATLGQETVTIDFGQTAAVGAFQMTNFFTSQTYGTSSPCLAEPGFEAHVTVLGPSAP